MQKFKNALVSVSNKNGLVEFIKPLSDAGTRIVSTGGTAQALRQAGVPVVDVSEQTGFPEVMGGRVKTLHPRVHMALLARRDHKEDLELLESSGLMPFDLVVGNLYPFENALISQKNEESLTEYIDIGGPSFLRAAAKSFKWITTIVDPDDYQSVLNMPQVTSDVRRELAAKVFYHTSSYDSMIGSYLSQGELYANNSIGGELMAHLRYGENPQQKAAWYRVKGQEFGLHQAEIIQGKALSYNNLLDLDAAVSCLSAISCDSAVVAVKHLNPCGVAIAKNGLEAVEKALSADPVSVFGGIIALNVSVNKKMAEKLSGMFLECIVAPGYEPDALEVFSTKKNLRLLRWEGLVGASAHCRVRSVAGGYLIQSKDEIDSWNSAWKVIGDSPSESIQRNLTLAWQICAHLKSNAIAIVSGERSVGLGMGQVNRVDAVEQAIIRMKNYHPDCDVPVLASDAFFPFPDSVVKAADAGIKWIIQPGGSIKDKDVISVAQELGINLVLTGKRHFQH